MSGASRTTSSAIADNSRARELQCRSAHPQESIALDASGFTGKKTVNPQDKVKAAMERAGVDAYFYMQERRVKLLDAQGYWPDRHWGDALRTDASGGFEYETADAVQIDQRADMFFPGTFYPKQMPKRPATVYLLAGRDSKGRRLQAGKNYRLRVPADMPVSQFWALIVYDTATYAFIYNPLSRVDRSWHDRPSMTLNDDGSVDLYFGPKAPAGLESNWIPTQGNAPSPVMRFYGPTDALWNKTFKLPDVELVK